MCIVRFLTTHPCWFGSAPTNKKVTTQPLFLPAWNLQFLLSFLSPPFPNSKALVAYPDPPGQATTNLLQGNLRHGVGSCMWLVCRWICEAWIDMGKLFWMGNILMLLEQPLWYCANKNTLLLGWQHGPPPLLGLSSSLGKAMEDPS